MGIGHRAHRVLLAHDRALYRRAGDFPESGPVRAGRVAAHAAPLELFSLPAGNPQGVSSWS